MTASIINGKHVATDIKISIKQQVEHATQQGHRPPGLAVVLLGEDHASAIYVNGKRKACLDVGFKSFAYNLSAKTTEHELLALIDTLNQTDDVDGILVQLPLPPHINTDTIIEHINPNKDVDGFHPYNFGRLAQGNPTLRPCTPYGVMQLLNYYQLDVRGKHAVVIGASNIVGRPMALEFLLAKATVTMCHSLTNNLEQYVRQADIIVSATGVRNIVDVEWLNLQQIIIDVGMHRLSDNSICGDIDFHQAKNKVAWITPVPGGVGPMTIATLMQNTLSSWKKT
ncbi:MAG: bifunctional methylenetetrahydrofolate dehydrogenase/methenyltetrahydrofolate cyclohydrolase FolD [Legionellaceae bacterium]|nr:bifunctional methylenetetrahydrofolate dehydrogenase/methenyltetrahydrofolate cyclohydrolase FolD [Legionellaceae bacterium]